MPEFKNPHEMEMDRATSKLELVRVNPTREFLGVDLDENGKWTGSPHQYKWQNGHWFDAGNQWIQDESKIPQFYRDQIKANPPTGSVAAGPAVTAVCRFCGNEMNQSEIEQHYVEHVSTAMAAAGKQSEPVQKNDANKHGRV